MRPVARVKRASSLLGDPARTLRAAAACLSAPPDLATAVRYGPALWARYGLLGFSSTSASPSAACLAASVCDSSAAERLYSAKVSTCLAYSTREASVMARASLEASGAHLRTSSAFLAVCASL